MISLITCSVRPDVCQRMLDSVSKTIGAEYEAIVYDNREKKHGICRAYNEGAKNAAGDYLCFVHEDIVIATEGWGKRLIDFVNENGNCGVVGLAGGKIALKNFYNWGGDGKNFRCRYYDPPTTAEKMYNSANDSGLIYRYRNPENEDFSKVVTLDGLFIFTSRKVWKENPFDENNFASFHFYDADFTFAVAQRYQNYAYLGMDVYHFSGGSTNMAYCDNMFLFQKKWNDHLPYCLPGYKSTAWREMRCAATIFHLHRQNGFSVIESLKRILSTNGTLFTVFFCGGLVVEVLLRFVMRRPIIGKADKLAKERST